MTLAAGTRLGPYEVRSPIGTGGMGEVYAARDTRLDRSVAIKVLPAALSSDPELCARFEREAKTVAALNHPHICTLHDIGNQDGSLFLVMELLEGESLRARLAQNRPPLPAVVEIAIQLADALESAHAKGIVHRDIKPENIFLTVRGAAKLLDFGIAKLATEQAPAGAMLTATRVETGPLALGTVAYMSPEQVRGEALDARTDFFSLGVVFYEMATGTQPFKGTTSAAVLGEILTKAPTAPVRLNADVPSEFERIVNKLLEKDRELRYQTARDVWIDLERLRRSLTESRTDAVLPVRQDASIVVLPFANLSPDPDNAFFADGLTEEVIADLSKIRALRVISRTSAMLLKGARKDLPSIGRELNVRYVLEGSVRRAASHLRITVQLIEASTDTHVWADKYSGTIDDVFEIQERLSRTIVDALKLQLTPQEDRWLAARELPDARAFDAYLKAHQEMYKMTRESLDRAFDLVNGAIASTGPNALLYATLGQIHFHYHDAGVHPDEATLDAAESWSDQALALVPDCAPASLVRGLLAWKRGHMADAIANMRRAADAGATDALAWLAYFCFQVGKPTEARQAAERMASADPLFWFSRWALATAALGEGHFQQALLHVRSAFASTGGEPLAQMWLAPLLVYAGETEEAIATCADLARTDAGILTDIGRVFGPMLRGDREAAERALAATSFGSFARNDKECAWFLVLGFAHLGDYDATLDWLGTAIDLGFYNRRFWSEIDPVLAPLRRDPRFLALMERAKQKERVTS